MSAKSEAMGRLRRQRRLRGLCAECGRPSDWSYRCGKCEAKRAKAQRARRERQRVEREREGQR